jgi:hypothetical protein
VNHSARPCAGPAAAPAWPAALAWTALLPASAAVARIPPSLTPNLPPALPLRDIHPPPPPGWWPPAPGWWLLGALLLAGLAWLGLLALRAHRHRRRRARLLAELQRLADGADTDPALVAAVSALLKRVALARWPREQVAALTGADWLAWLDRTGGAGAFTDGPGRVLADGPYAPAAPGLDRPALLALAGRWLTRNG